MEDDGTDDVNLGEAWGKYNPDERPTGRDTHTADGDGGQDARVDTEKRVKVMDRSPSSTAKAPTEAEKDQKNIRALLHKPSTRHTVFKPSESNNPSRFKRLSKVDHSTVHGDLSEKELQRYKHRQEDIEMLSDRFQLDKESERWVTYIVHNTDLSQFAAHDTENGSFKGNIRYENLILAALRFVFRVKRNSALREESGVSDERYAKEYTEIREIWNCDVEAITNIYKHIREEYHVGS